MSNFTTAIKVAVAIMASNTNSPANLTEMPSDLNFSGFSRNLQSTDKEQQKYTVSSLRNPKVSLSPEISGEYAEHLENFATKLNDAIKAGTSVSPYINADTAKIYAKMCRRCENSFEVLLLSRAIPNVNSHDTSISAPDMKSTIPEVISFGDCLNPKISLDPNKSGEYSTHLAALVSGLNYAIEKGSILSPYISKDVAKEYYQKLAQKCENSFELMVLSRTLPAEAQSYAYKHILGS